MCETTYNVVEHLPVSPCQDHWFRVLLRSLPVSSRVIVLRVSATMAQPSVERQLKYIDAISTFVPRVDEKEVVNKPTPKSGRVTDS